MALSVDRPLRTMGVVVAPCRCRLPSADSMGASHRHSTVGTIQSSGNDLVTEDGNSLFRIRLLPVFMTGGAAGAGTQTTLADHPIFCTKFILDSGATSHSTGKASLFPWLIPVQQSSGICVANGHQLAVQGFGPVIMENFRVNNVLYVPGLTCNVISVSKLSELDYSVAFSRDGCLIKDLRTGKTVGSARLIQGLYHIDRLEIPLDRAPAVVP